jgi:hypothetical protein
MQADSQRCTRAARTRLRNRAALVLFGRSVAASIAAIGGLLGFFAGAELQRSRYDPSSFAVGVGVLFALACGALAW